MFNEIGNKIKKLAKIIFAIEIIASIFIGLILLIVGDTQSNGEGLMIAGFSILFLGWLAAWISSLFMYGFGELIDKTTEIARNTASYANNPIGITDNIENTQFETNPTKSPQKIKSSELGYMLRILNNQYETGKISEKDFQRKRNEIIESIK